MKCQHSSIDIDGFGNTFRYYVGEVFLYLISLYVGDFFHCNSHE